MYYYLIYIKKKIIQSNYKSIIVFKKYFFINNIYNLLEKDILVSNCIFFNIIINKFHY